MQTQTRRRRQTTVIQQISSSIRRLADEFIYLLMYMYGFLLARLVGWLAGSAVRWFFQPGSCFATVLFSMRYSSSSSSFFFFFAAAPPPSGGRCLRLFQCTVFLNLSSLLAAFGRFVRSAQKHRYSIPIKSPGAGVRPPVCPFVCLSVRSLTRRLVLSVPSLEL